MSAPVCSLFPHHGELDTLIQVTDKLQRAEARVKELEGEAARLRSVIETYEGAEGIVNRERDRAALKELP